MTSQKIAPQTPHSFGSLYSLLGLSCQSLSLRPCLITLRRATSSHLGKIHSCKGSVTLTCFAWTRCRARVLIGYRVNAIIVGKVTNWIWTILRYLSVYVSLPFQYYPCDDKEDNWEEHRIDGKLQDKERGGCHLHYLSHLPVLQRSCQPSWG